MESNVIITKMVEQQIFKKTKYNKNELNIIDNAAFNSKNLYNYANYLIRQVFSGLSKKAEGKELTEQEQKTINDINNFIKKYNEENKDVKRKNKNGELESKKLFKELSENNKYLSFELLDKYIKESEPYRSLPAQASQQILRLLDKNWKSFFKAIKEYKKHPEKFSGRPKLPKYKDKEKGRNILIFKNPIYKDGYVFLPKQLLNIKFKTTIDQDLIKELRIIPKNGCYKIEVVYEKEIEPLNLDPSRIIGIDLGIDNLATVANNVDLKPFIIDGKKLKSINQYFNKTRAKLMSYVGDRGTSKRIQQLTNKRNRQVEDYMHKASKYIIDWCIKNNMGTIIVGKNVGWKQETDMGKVNNQKFVSIPHARFIKMLEYKAKNVGINFQTNEESYTSKASFLDGDEIPTYKRNIKSKKDYKQDKQTYCNFSGKRGISTGNGGNTDRLYQSKNGTIINADLNGAYNIIRKHIPNAFNDCDKFYLHPERVYVFQK